MNDLQAAMRCGSVFQRPFSDAEDNRIWLSDSRLVSAPASANPRNGQLSALFEMVEGGARREFVAEQTEFIKQSNINHVSGRHFTAPPHQAYAEAVGVAFLEDLPNGYYSVTSGVAAINYQLYFRAPPCCPDGDVAVSFKVISGMILLQNDWMQGVVAGSFRDVLVRIHKVDHDIGVGPGQDYEMKMLNGRFRVHL